MTAPVPAGDPTRVYPLSAPPPPVPKPLPLETYLVLLLITLGPLLWWLLATLPGSHWWAGMICPAAWIAAVTVALAGTALRERRAGR